MRKDHCSFKALDENGKCIANCFHNQMKDGRYIDCIGRKSESLEANMKRVKIERKYHAK